MKIPKDIDDEISQMGKFDKLKGVTFTTGVVSVSELGDGEYYFTTPLQSNKANSEKVKPVVTILMGFYMSKCYIDTRYPINIEPLMNWVWPFVYQRFRDKIDIVFIIDEHNFKEYKGKIKELLK